MESYVVTEIMHLKDHFDIFVVTFGSYIDPVAKVEVEYETIESEKRLDEIINSLKPDILHGHFLETIELIGAASARHKIPYTIRSHSYDIADQRFVERLEEFAALANGELCLGVLGFPYARQRLEAAGFRSDKIIDTGPVFWFDKFYDPSPRKSTRRMFGLGSAWPKKNLAALIDLAPSLPDLQIHIYAAGGLLSELKQYNGEKGAPVTFVPHAPFYDMPAVYRKYDWYIYPGKSDQCGMPVSILEAQASGIGVLHQYTRPEDHAFVDGGGYVYEEIDDIVDILANEYPAEMRSRGFENASRWDIRRHIGDVASLWYDRLEDRAERIKKSFAKDFKQSFLSRMQNRVPEHVPVYIIHLKRNFDRHVHLCETLLPKLPAAEVMAAYDGVKGEPLSDCRTEGIAVSVDEYASYTPVKLACSLSHVKACKRLVATGARLGVILEDDVDIADDFYDRLKEILERTPWRFDIVHLLVHPEYAPDYRRQAAGQERHVIRYAPRWGRSAYVVSRAGAKKIIKGFRNVTNHGDIQMADMSAQKQLNVYCATETIVANLGQAYSDYRGERFRSNIHAGVAG
jgi:GR25 family glycosyltransferase involved in LPS biosynthesis/glycosyltransferase involved in cell wall biosynthesis